MQQGPDSGPTELARNRAGMESMLGMTKPVATPPPRMKVAIATHHSQHQGRDRSGSSESCVASTYQLGRQTRARRPPSLTALPGADQIEHDPTVREQQQETREKPDQKMCSKTPFEGGLVAEYPGIQKSGSGDPTHYE